MKWSFVIQQKLKAAMLLGGIMALIILATLLSRRNMDGIDKSFSSIYQDRLIPATTIIYLTENLYGKRLSLEEYLLTNGTGNKNEIRAQLSTHNKNIDSLIKAFEQTYLVDEEARSLTAFKNEVHRYTALEKSILGLYNAGAQEEGKRLFAGVGANTFKNTITNLNELTNIQSSIGKDLMKESKSDIASFGIISFLQIALAVVIGLMLLVLIQNSSIVNKPKISGQKNQYFNLN
ncbi:MCP four helix bundle domain-containing protein [Dyadobacter chenhuakuii]|uniref:MCP four helix bundle domain-containing protein n=1 Tax=Dyadobacter chenhuakuii TaxID=2909339 RepID=A0ABY4XLP3_9BACT|nr:MCP four helix bundle domain-containing protein [Dyadobacter chenhuakuii]MCF2494242.1 MCP four helix bundle domain-containing protein [Dyadobacter chenhuakuii]USJ31369.1 MCP four helix bundle domain-containing protein [Dyadobacter chenhuakuii]